MEYWSELQNYQSLRRLLELASARTSTCWRFCFGSTLSNVVYRVKQEYSSRFSELLARYPAVFVSLDLGHHVYFQEAVVRYLDFSTPGRAVSAIAFICFVLDRWSAQTRLSPGYTLDYLTMSLWRAMLRKRRVSGFSPARPPHGLDPVLEESELEEEENPRAGLDPPAE
ncbi:E1B 19K [Simian adenovirus 18]|uniref:E1B protein, small T-antigen n=1 Tax=Simian adenovirus 18 TaxID=909210 RepID=H8PFZ1_9ADEN|nr:E1B 19K [Simian adenovirus 18]AFD10557.1 E1B 19K [Simian adenovirus 18]